MTPGECPAVLAPRVMPLVEGRETRRGRRARTAATRATRARVARPRSVAPVPAPRATTITTTAATAAGSRTHAGRHRDSATGSPLPLAAAAPVIISSGSDARPGQTTSLPGLPANGPDTLRILTLNAEHLMSPAIGQRWLDFCGAQQWQDTPGQRRPPALPYCTALNGQDQRGRQQSRPVRSLTDLADKTRQLAALVADARADIVLMQEVTDAEAVAAVLGAGWTIHSTAERWSGGPISQNLAVAWRTARLALPPHVEVVETLARPTTEGHLTRPGLALHLEPLPGLRLSILNVHLKAGCRHGRLERGLSRQPGRHWRRQAACAVLQAQVPALESWLDQQLLDGRHVILGGDFNRVLRDEIRHALPARADGALASTQVDTAEAIRQISSILPELDDGSPPAARLHLLRNGNYRRHADCHRHIDPFLLDDGLLSRLGLTADSLRVEVLPFAGPVSLDAPRASDHCPHLLALPLPRR